MEARRHRTVVCLATLISMDLVELTAEAFEWGETVRRELKEVILVASSSRGGSSVFTEYLRHSNALLHMRGEFNPWLNLCGLGYPHSGTGSDALGEAELIGKSDALWARLGAEIGNMSSTADAWAPHPFAPSAAATVAGNPARGRNGQNGHGIRAQTMASIQVTHWPLS